MQNVSRLQADIHRPLRFLNVKICHILYFKGRTLTEICGFPYTKGCRKHLRKWKNSVGKWGTSIQGNPHAQKGNYESWKGHFLWIFAKRWGWHMPPVPQSLPSCLYYYFELWRSQLDRDGGILIEISYAKNGNGSAKGLYAKPQ